MGYIVGEGRGQHSLFPVSLEELVPTDHACRVIDAFVGTLDLVRLGFVRAQAASTGRPGYDPADMLKLYLYGYLQQIRSSRRLETECRRNVELMWLLGRLSPDHKAIAEFRKMHSEAVTQAGAQLVQLARAVGLVRGEWVAVDGSKFRAVSSTKSVNDLAALRTYLESMDAADTQDALTLDHSATAAALRKLQEHPEPEARFMRTTGGKVPAYNVQTAVDAEHAIIVAQAVTTEATDNRSLQPMAQKAQEALGVTTLNIVADAGYSNGEQASACEASGLLPHVPANRSLNPQGNGDQFDRTAFQYSAETDTYVCPSGKTLQRNAIQNRDRLIIYAAQRQDCQVCPLKAQCTTGSRRFVSRHFDEDALNRMHQRATPAVMRLRRSTVEHPFATLKYRIFGHPRFLMRGKRGAQAEMSIAVMVYNLKRMINILGADSLVQHCIA